MKAEAEIWNDNYSASLQLCHAGHAVVFRGQGVTVTEVASPRDCPLPQAGQLLGDRIEGNRHETIRFDNGVRYHASYHLETLDLEVFLNAHQELLRDSLTATVAYTFPTAGRFDPAPLSLITTDCTPNSLLVNAFHTFPETGMVVKTQSLLEL